jgi:raffinose/stachyose/melibiose transport system permease protein
MNLPSTSGTYAVQRISPAGVFAFAFVVMVLFPFAWVLRIATRPQSSYLGNESGLGGGFTLSNFSKAWTVGSLGSGFLNSIVIVPAGALLATLLAVCAGYGLAKLKPHGTRVMLLCIGAAIAIPVPAIVIPIFDLALRLGMVDSRAGLSLIFGVIFAAWGTMFMYASFQALPDVLLDGARVDGAGELGSFVLVAIPLAIPSIMSCLFINCFAQWSELLLSLVLLPNHQPVSVGIALYQSQFRTGGPLTAAGQIMVALPVLILYFFAQRFLRRGTLGGAVKA